MSLASVEPRIDLERRGYLRLSLDQLRALGAEPEALYELGFRLREGLGDDNASDGRALILRAAELGHPVALALCFANGLGVEKDENRAKELCTASAERGHAAGNEAPFVNMSSYC